MTKVLAASSNLPREADLITLRGAQTLTEFWSEYDSVSIHL